MPELSEYGFVENNGVKIEYGIYGDMNTEPLLLLPPNGGHSTCFEYTDTVINPALLEFYGVTE